MNTCIIGYDSEKPSEKNNKLANSMFLKKNSKSKSKSNEESSYRMEKLLEKNSKNESTFDKQEKFIEFYINDNKKNIILSISGGYSSQLDVINCRYINMNDYFGNILGYFELRIKMKNDKVFKNKVDSNLDKYEDSDRILLKACLLPESCFNEIIQFCMW